jgi:transcriptional regulator with PAS, ATPase and Fis domain
VKKHAQRTGRRVERIDEGGLAGPASSDWPGNVREAREHDRARRRLSPDRSSRRGRSPCWARRRRRQGLPSLKLRQNIRVGGARETIRRALENAGGVKDAAELMGISQRRAPNYLAKYRSNRSKAAFGYRPSAISFVRGADGKLIANKKAET